MMGGSLQQVVRLLMGTFLTGTLTAAAVAISQVAQQLKLKRYASSRQPGIFPLT
jgi:hypothetical protein